MKEGIPEMTKEVEWFFTAWSRLSKGRDNAGGKTIQAISIPQMESYMRMFNYAGGADVFIDSVQEMDRLYMARVMSN